MALISKPWSTNASGVCPPYEQERQAELQGEEFRFDDVVAHVSPGDLFEVLNALFTRREYDPFSLSRGGGATARSPSIWLRIWARRRSLRVLPQAVQNRDILLGPEEPRISSAQESPFRSEPSVSVDDRHLLATYWMVYLGAYAMETGLNTVIHRTHV